MRGTELVRERERTVLYLVPSLLLKDGCVHTNVSLDGSLSEGEFCDRRAVVACFFLQLVTLAFATLPRTPPAYRGPQYLPCDRVSWWKLHVWTGH